MTQEEKQILLKDLCTRLPYGVICQLSNKDAGVSIIEKLELGGLEHFITGNMCVKPYLRPMSSMTEEEIKEAENISRTIAIPGVGDWYKWLTLNATFLDYLISHHFDYRGLIPMGLALEAEEGMYKTE